MVRGSGGVGEAPRQEIADCLAGKGCARRYGDLTSAAIVTAAGRDDLSGRGGSGDKAGSLMSPVLRWRFVPGDA